MFKGTLRTGRASKLTYIQVTSYLEEATAFIGNVTVTVTSTVGSNHPPLPEPDKKDLSYLWFLGPRLDTPITQSQMTCLVMWSMDTHETDMPIALHFFPLWKGKLVPKFASFHMLSRINRLKWIMVLRTLELIPLMVSAGLQLALQSQVCANSSTGFHHYQLCSPTACLVLQWDYLKQQ